MKRSGQLDSQGGRKIAHRVEGIDALLPEPMRNLPRAIRTLANARDRSLQVLQQQVADIARRAGRIGRLVSMLVGVMIGETHEPAIVTEMRAREQDASTLRFFR